MKFQPNRICSFWENTILNIDTLFCLTGTHAGGTLLILPKQRKSSYVTRDARAEPESVCQNNVTRHTSHQQLLQSARGDLSFCQNNVTRHTSHQQSARGDQSVCQNNVTRPNWKFWRTFLWKLCIFMFDGYSFNYKSNFHIRFILRINYNFLMRWYLIFC